MEQLLNVENLTLSAALVAIAIGAWNLLQKLLEEKGGKLIDTWTQSAQTEREIAQAKAQAAIQAGSDEREQTQLMQLRAFESSNQTMAALLEELKTAAEFQRKIAMEKLDGAESAVVRIHSRLDKIEELAERERQQRTGQIRAITEGHKEAMAEIGLSMAALTEKISAWTEAINTLRPPLGK